MEETIFNKAFNRAAELMNDDRFNAIVESKANAYSGANKGKNDVNPFTNYESVAFGASTNNTQQTTMQQQNFNVPTMNSKLPSAILESFAKTPTFNNSDPLSTITVKAQQPQATITETVSHPNNGGIDYSLIKMIVDECITKKLGELTNGILTESSNNVLRGLRFAEGNKIQFVDNKGNLYEGELKLKKKKK